MTVKSAAFILLAGSEARMTTDVAEPFQLFGNLSNSRPEGLNCTPTAVDDFPWDGFTMSDRRHGWIIVHVLIALYVIGGLAIVCDDYFVPLMHEFSEQMNVPTDIAGATFMAFGTSCPELFISLIGAFITEGDIGVGAVLGSAVFNILAIASVCGLCAGTVIALNWRPLTRDCLMFLIAVGTLLYIIEDEKIYWYESLILVLEYIIYIVIMYLNTRFQKYCSGPTTSYDLPKMESGEYTLDKAISYSRKSSVAVVSNIYDENIIAYHNQFNIIATPEKKDDTPNGTVKSINSSVLSSQNSSTELIKPDLSDLSSNMAEEDEESIWRRPRDSRLRLLVWILWWPMKFVYNYTIPVRKDKCCCLLSILSFIICIVYIGLNSYVAAWMVSIIGSTIKVPDSVMGLTFLALGSSLPEIVSSVIVSRQSLGNMALSNALGGNVFTLLMCLGAPWLAKATLPSHEPFVRIYSQGLTYSVLALFLSVVVMYIVVSLHRFRLNKKVGALCLFMYIVYVTLSCLYEMNVFGLVNLRPCPHDRQ